MKHKLTHLSCQEVSNLRVGDNVMLRFGRQSYVPAVVTRTAFWNSDADEPEMEIETTNGFADAYSVYRRE